ncbi:MBL fold metallo-hydrolase [Oscillochloris sp. ZM17-4]|uniref:MBL fold metallo-hydrolase n=1 Tax=Oscillochloris sp. ZM17-4 TaxID=2866714 RepID=UPI001C72A681|nr:MBL fold metallo-hydrolase [Oscillochloris sp. ZM17-4]MBX0329432.1 MBL fold metallo-hydrolase [Oscillochloris sp. ZM17-4]
MQRNHHGDYMVQLTQLWSMNSYLVREDDGLTLIDSGMSGAAPAILAAARELGAPIVRIVLTHAHIDHVGSLDALAAALPEATVVIGAREARFMAGDMTLDPDEPQAKLAGGFPKVVTRPGRLLSDGDMVGSLWAVAAPGHTPGQMAFFDTRDGTLIAGDSFQTLGGVAVAGVMRPLFPLPAMATWHLPTALRTARRLRALGPSRMGVGHGRVLESPEAAMDAAIAEAEARASRMVTSGS